MRKQITCLRSIHNKDVSCLKKTINRLCEGTGIVSLQGIGDVTNEENCDVAVRTNVFQFKPIGHVQTCFVRKNCTPRQGSLCPEAKGCLRIILPNSQHFLRGIQEYSHVWLVFVFDQNKRSQYMRSTVAPPRLNGKRLGILATRSPHRPNAIGLTLTKLLGVEGDTLYFGGIDLVDGTAVLDIKPYIPHYDSPKTSEGLASSDGEIAVVPSWIENRAGQTSLEVRFTSTAIQQVQTLDAGSIHRKNLKKLITEVLTTDPRSIYRRQQCSDRLYYFIVDGAHVTVWFDENQNISIAEVLNVKPVINKSS